MRVSNAIGTGLLLLLAVSCCVRPACGARVSVSGTADATAAAAVARAGSEIVLADGTYRDLRLTIAAEGEASRPIVLRAASPGGAVLTGMPQLRITGAWVEVRGLALRGCEPTTGSKGAIVLEGSRSCRVTSCTFERSRFGALPLVAFRDAARDNRVDNCRFTDTRYRCVMVVVDSGALKSGPPLRNRIDHNLFQDTPPRGQNGAETVQIGQSAAPLCDLRPMTVVENNVFLRCNGEAEIISVKTTGNIIRNNVFRDCEGEVVLRHGHENTVEGNHFAGCKEGVRVYGDGHRVCGNVIANCAATGIRLGYGTPDLGHPAAYLPVYGCTITGNTITDCPLAGLLVGSARNQRHENRKWAGPPWHASAVMECTVAPHGNTIANNAIAGSEGVLVMVDHAPDNDIRDNAFRATGSAATGVEGHGALIAGPGNPWPPAGFPPPVGPPPAGPQ